MGHRVVEVGQDGFYEGFGLGARDQDGGRYLEGEAVKLLRAEDVLNGLEAEAALDQALDGGELLAGEGALGVGDEGGAVEAERVHKQHGRVGDGGGPQVGVRGELAGGAGEGFSNVDQG